MTIANTFKEQFECIYVYEKNKRWNSIITQEEEE